jgi:hypothetical protein
MLDFSPKGPVSGPDPWKNRLDLIEAGVLRGKQCTDWALFSVFAEPFEIR